MLFRAASESGSMSGFKAADAPLSAGTAALPLHLVFSRPRRDT
jgi:hypothetical protein